MKFKVVEYRKKVDNGWRLATINDVRSSMQDVKKELHGKDWHICALQDGNVGGPGYDYEIKREVKELGHKLIVKSNPYPNQNFAYPPNPPVNSGYKQPYNPGAYPPQQNVYPSAAQPPITGYPPSHPSAVGPPPPYYPADPNLQNAYPPMQSSYPPVQNPPAYAPASYPQTTIASGAYDPCARFGSGATPNIPPPPPGVMPNSAQMASMQGRPVMMQQQNSSNMISGPPGGGSTFW